MNDPTDIGTTRPRHTGPRTATASLVPAEITAELIDAGRAAGALSIRTAPPFRWASGALMPIYNDNRRLLATLRGRAVVRRGLGTIADSLGLDVDAVAGTASAGIAPATLLAEELGLPLYYVRKEPKDHGTAQRIEGMAAVGIAGERVLLVEDLVSTGGSSVAAAEALQEAGATVVACLAIFSYGFPAAVERFNALPGSPPVFTLASVGDLVTDGATNGWLSPAEIDLVQDWVEDPFGWYGRVSSATDARADVGTRGGSQGGGGHPADTRDGGEPSSPAIWFSPEGEKAAEAIRTHLGKSARNAGHLLCVGLDPQPDLIPAGVGVAEFLRTVVEEIAAVGPPPAAFKPNIAYFHQLDRPRHDDFSGSRALAALLKSIREVFPSVPVILDAKRGDIAGTSAAYSREAFTAWEANALTVSPFMGDDSVEPFLSAASDSSTSSGGPVSPRWIYVLNRTSNPGAGRFQDLGTGNPPQPIYETVATTIQEWQARYGTAGAVIGATVPAEMRRLLKIHGALPLPILVPGVGAQGAGARDVITRVRESGYPPELVRINASRQVVSPWARKGTAPSGWRGAIRDNYGRLAEEAAWR